MNEELEVNAFITGELPLEEINEAFTQMKEGKRLVSLHNSYNGYNCVLYFIIASGQ